MKWKRAEWDWVRVAILATATGFVAALVMAALGREWDYVLAFLTFMGGLATAEWGRKPGTLTIRGVPTPPPPRPGTGHLELFPDA